MGRGIKTSAHTGDYAAKAHLQGFLYLVKGNGRISAHADSGRVYYLVFLISAIIIIIIPIIPSTNAM